MVAKVDFKRELDCYRAGQDHPRIVEVPDLRYLMIDGHGDPNAPAFAEALQTLYPVAYKIKFASKTLLNRDYVVPPLEGLWWAPDMDAFTTARDKTQWDWTVMIMVPSWISVDVFETARKQVASGGAPARLGDLRLETLSEGMCVQALHVGSYDDEGSLLSYMHEEFIPGQRMTMTGKHHEIYLSDARRTQASKLRTILRQPVSFEV